MNILQSRSHPYLPVSSTRSRPFPGQKCRLAGGWQFRRRWVTMPLCSIRDLAPGGCLHVRCFLHPAEYQQYPASDCDERADQLGCWWYLTGGSTCRGPVLRLPHRGLRHDPKPGLAAAGCGPDCLNGWRIGRSFQRFHDLPVQTAALHRHPGNVGRHTRPGLRIFRNPITPQDPASGQFSNAGAGSIHALSVDHAGSLLARFPFLNRPQPAGRFGHRREREAVRLAGSTSGGTSCWLISSRFACHGWGLAGLPLGIAQPSVGAGFRSLMRSPPV